MFIWADNDGRLIFSDIPNYWLMFILESSRGLNCMV